MKRFGEKLRWKDQAFSKITGKVENYIVCKKHVNNMQIVKQVHNCKWYFPWLLPIYMF